MLDIERLSLHRYTLFLMALREFRQVHAASPDLIVLHPEVLAGLVQSAPRDNHVLTMDVRNQNLYFDGVRLFVTYTNQYPALVYQGKAHVI